MTKYRNLDHETFDSRWIQAVDAFRRGDRAGALFQFKRLARDGCAPALMEVANIYELGGDGISIDNGKAIEWYLHAVECIDDVKAHFGLGRLYLKVGSDPQNYYNARYHLELVVDHNNSMGALFGLGLIYECGLGTKKDYEQAITYYRRAEEQGHLLGQLGVARINIKQSRYKSGYWQWLKAFFKTFNALYRNKNDLRVGIRIR